MHDPCYEWRKHDNSNVKGECCCNCNFQRPINAHPWNKGFAKGVGIIGYGCTHPEFWPNITFFEKEHGMCGVWTEREWPDPTKEQVWIFLNTNHKGEIMSYELKFIGSVSGLDLDDKRHKLMHLLENHDCEVTFTKINGELRTMPCTLRIDSLPSVITTESKKKPNPDVMSVWCIDKKAWRSFRIANVTEIRVISLKNE